MSPVETSLPPLQAVELGQFLSMQLAEPEPILGRLLREGSLAMVHGRAGTGKTFLMLSMAISAAYGVPFLGWEAKKPVPVVYFDGEMTATDMQQRLRELMRWIEETIDHLWQPLYVITPDFQPCGFSKIDTPEGKEAVLQVVERVRPRLVVLDNLSCLTNPEDDNASSSWSAVQELLLSLRRQGVAAVVGHHSGKNGEQRGTSRRADILDLVWKLTPILDAEADGRTRVQIEFEKARGLSAEEKEAFVATLEPHPQGGIAWSRSAPAAAVGDRVRQMLADGMSPGDVASELKTSRSYVYRIRAELQKNEEIPQSSRRGVPCPLSKERGTRGHTSTSPGTEPRGLAGDSRGQEVRGIGNHESTNSF